MDAVLNWVWQGSVVAVALAVMLRLLERARASVRCALCWAALFLVIALPVLSGLAAMAPRPGRLAAFSSAVVNLSGGYLIVALLLIFAIVSVLGAYLAWTLPSSALLLGAGALVCQQLAPSRYNRPPPPERYRIAHDRDRQVGAEHAGVAEDAELGDAAVQR